MEKLPYGSGPAIVPFPMPTQRFRIGSKQHGYVYNEVGRNVFKCERGSDWARQGQLLFLFRIHCPQTTYWVAADAHADSVIVEGFPAVCEYVFRSTEDVLDEGLHMWESNFGAHQGYQSWKAGLQCLTEQI